MAVSSFDKKHLSYDDQLRIESATNAAQSGKMSWEKAHSIAEKIRGDVGYSGGVDGSEYIVPQREEPLQEQFQPQDFNQYLEQMGLGDYQAETQRAIQAAVDRAVNGYKSQIGTTELDSAELARQAYVAKMLGQKNLNQQLSASGYSGGMADSQKLATETNYQNNLTDIETQKAETVQKLNAAIENARLTGDMQTAQELAGYLQNLQGQWAGYVQSQQQRNDAQNQNAAEAGREDSNTAFSRVMTLLSSGMMPSAAMLSAAGLTMAQAQQMMGGAAGQQGGTAVRPKRTYQTTPSTWEETETPEMAAEKTNAGMNVSYFSAFAQSVAAQLAAGKDTAAQANIDANWGNLSSAQKKQLLDLTQKYGY